MRAPAILGFRPLEMRAAAFWAAAPSVLRSSGDLQILVLQRERAVSLAGRREDGVEHGRRGYEDCRLADAAPEVVARHDDRLHLRHLRHAERAESVEVRFDDGTVLDRDAAVEQRGQAIDERAMDLPVNLRRIDGMTGIGRR